MFILMWKLVKLLCIKVELILMTIFRIRHTLLKQNGMEVLFF